MVNPRNIQERYSRMSDDELIALAQNELTTLTDTAVKILYNEFQSRGLDGSLYFGDEFKARAKASAMEYAFNERKKGKQDEHIIADLMNIGLSDEQAWLIVKRLPKSDYKNEQFEKLITKGGDNVSIGVALIRLFLFGLAGYMILMGIGHHFPTFTVVGIIFALGGVYAVFSSKGDIKGGKYWISLIYEKPTDIIWIKPIVEKHTIGYIFTMFKVQHFQFLTKDRSKVTLKIDSKEEQEIFFEGVRHLLPHTQIGYSLEIEDLYEENSFNFINELQARHLYTPFDTYAK